MASYSDTLTEDISTTITDQVGYSLSLILAIEMDDTSLSSQIINILEAIDVSDILGTLSSEFHVSSSDTFDIADMVAVLWQNTILEDIENDDSVTSIIRRIELLTDLVNIYDSGLSTGILNASVAVTLALQDLISYYGLEVIIDSVEAQDTLVDLLTKIGVIMDDLSTADTVTNYVSFFTLVEDDLSGSDILLNTAELNEYLSEGWIVTTSYTHNGETYSGWVMNPENYAISNYTNFQFNSVTYFAYETLLANSSGIYTMDSTTDSGSYINSKIKTAAMTFGTTSQKQIPEVLLGVNNTGKVILVVTTDGQMTTTYQLDVPSAYLDTQRIKIGKGVHGRYWQFELHTLENSEFDLDTFEFFPITWGRKIR